LRKLRIAHYLLFAQIAIRISAFHSYWLLTGVVKINQDRVTGTFF